MPTNDERREAVRFLRTAICTESDCDTCREMSAKLFPPSDDSCFDGHSTLCRLDNEGDGVIWRRLADLIEPEPELTCRMIDNGVELCCSVCDRRHGYDDEPDFCMGCGAKVVHQ